MTDCDRLLLRRICRLMARTGRGDTHQACPLLKVNRPCHLAAVTSQFDPQPTWGKLKSRIATALCYPLRREAREEQGSETARLAGSAAAWPLDAQRAGVSEYVFPAEPIDGEALLPVWSGHQRGDRIMALGEASGCIRVRRHA